MMNGNDLGSEFGDNYVVNLWLSTPKELTIKRGAPSTFPSAIHPYHSQLELFSYSIVFLTSLEAILFQQFVKLHSKFKSPKFAPPPSPSSDHRCAALPPPSRPELHRLTSEPPPTAVGATEPHRALRVEPSLSRSSSRWMLRPWQFHLVKKKGLLHKLTPTFCFYKNCPFLSYKNYRLWL